MRYGRPVRNILGCLAALALVVGPLIAHFGVVRPLAGFGVFALGGIVSLLVGLASLVQLVRGRGLKVGGALAVLTGVIFFAIAQRGSGYPHINDFTTDLADPPTFSFAAGLPANAGRDMSYPPDFAAIQRECCAELRPAKVTGTPRDVYERVLRVSSETPAWRVTRADAAAGVVEAVATTAVFHFEDDIVIRVRPDADGTTRVDIRSKSRDGKGDIGANTTRIRQFVEHLEASR
jgi:uncharacterized protein (DUF1499 family)